MRVLDLGAGKGGWSIPFIEDGDEVIGIDIVNAGYPKGGQLILQDIATVDGTRFGGFDFVVGSMPCSDFSTAGQINKSQGKKAPNPENGLRLIAEFNRVVREAKPRFWAMENVKRLEKFYAPKPIWRFRMSKAGIRSLWGNITIPPLVQDYRSERRINLETRNGNRVKNEVRGAERAKIPYPIARFVANTVKKALQ